MKIEFYEDPLKRGKPRGEVRFKQLGLYVHEDRRRVAVGFDITPFDERPCIDVFVVNSDGVPAGSMHIVDIMESNFTLTMHLRDEKPTDEYQVTAVLYYATPDTVPEEVDRRSASFDLRIVGRQPSTAG